MAVLKQSEQKRSIKLNPIYCLLVIINAPRIKMLNSLKKIIIIIVQKRTYKSNHLGLVVISVVQYQNQQQGCRTNFIAKL